MGPNQRKSDGHSLAPTCLILLALSFFSAPFQPASGQEVGNSRDGCDGGRVVRFEGRDGEARIRAGETLRVRLPAMTREFRWFCGGSRERVANGRSFNEVLVTRASNGAIRWRFFVASDADTITRVGDTRDACDGGQAVRFDTTEGSISVPASQTRRVRLPALVREFNWLCGNDRNRVANPNSFNIVQIERAGNGAISWVFFRDNMIISDRTGRFIRNVFGGVNVPTPMGSASFSGTALKDSFNRGWAANAAMVRAAIFEELASEPSVRNPILALAQIPDNAEFRILEDANEVRLKYVAHENVLTATLVAPDPLPDNQFSIVFDIEVVLVFPRTFPPGSILAPLRSQLFVHKTEIGGGGLARIFGISRLRARETTINAISRALESSVVNAITAAISGAIDPTGTITSGSALPTQVRLDVNQAGVLTVCIDLPGGTCIFPTFGAIAGFALPRGLDTSVDRCGESLIWLWDAELGRFISVAKNAIGFAMVAGSRFEWFCGNSANPDFNDNEWAIGPQQTHAVRIQRDGGDRIDWQFLDWRR